MTGRIVVVIVVAGLVVWGCGGSAVSSSPTPASSSAGPGTDAPSASVPPPNAAGTPSATTMAPEPVCPERNPAWAERGSIQDGPDQDGRILFASEVRMDDVLGHVVGPLFAIDPDGSDLVRVLSCNVERPRFSPAGSRLAFSIEMDNGTWQVATSNPDGSDLRVLTNVAGLAETPDWGPDGSWLIYALGDEPCDPWPECIETGAWQYNLWRMNADGSDQRLIGHPNEIDWEPRVSPDGREVVFARYSLATALEPRITIRNLETGEERLATTDDQRPEHPDWSRDGKFVVYTTHWEAEGLQQIKRVPVDDPTAEPVVLYGDKGNDGFKAAYSPDGSRIVFGCGPAMCLMASDGSDVVELLHPPGAFPNHFAWGPPAP